jgi:hypothetical protein
MLKKYYIIIFVALMFIVQASVLYWLGHSLLAPDGSFQIWDGVVKGSENSQQLLDWYSFSHIITGFIIYFFLWLVGRKRGWPVWAMFLVALAISMGWEIFENSYYAISRFQHVTVYTNYYGDSIINSLMDTVCVGVGFLLAHRLPVEITILIAVALEIIIGLTIHDNLTVSIIMFVHPVAAILQWQSG